MTDFLDWILKVCVQDFGKQPIYTFTNVNTDFSLRENATYHFCHQYQIFL